MNTRLIIGTILMAVAGGFVTGQSNDARGGISISYEKDRVRILVGGELFTEYRFEGAGRPVLYPLNAKGSVGVTRSWPLDDARDGERKDHPHHRSVWFAHGEVNGHDFWGEGPKRGRIEHVGFVTKGADSFTVKNRWVSAKGQTVCTDTRSLRFSTRGSARIVDYAVCVTAADADLVFGDTKEGTMAIRVAAPLRTSGLVAKGRMVNSEGKSGKGIWGKRARWIDYSGPLRGRTVGVALLDHPKNPRHPTHWHARDYGLLAANPFGLRHFEGKKNGEGKLTIKALASTWWRYAIVVHEGDETAGEIEATWKAWAGGK